MSCESNGVRRLLGAVIYANQSDTRLNSDRVAIELGQLVFFAKREIPAHRDSWICKLAMCVPVAETEITEV